MIAHFLQIKSRFSGHDQEQRRKYKKTFTQWSNRNRKIYLITVIIRTEIYFLILIIPNLLQ